MCRSSVGYERIDSNDTWVKFQVGVVVERAIVSLNKKRQGSNSVDSPATV